MAALIPEKAPRFPLIPPPVKFADNGYMRQRLFPGLSALPWLPTLPWLPVLPWLPTLPWLPVLVSAVLLVLPQGNPAWADNFYPGHDIEVLRGELQIDMEPIYGGFIDPEYPLQTETLRRRALEEAATIFSAMIYGWSFHYDVGEKARGIAEDFSLSPLGSIPWGDQKLYVTDGELRDQKLCLWTDYRLDENQKRRVAMWRAGRIRSAQGLGRGPLGIPSMLEPAGDERQSAGDNGDPARLWLDYRREGLEDAARAAVRAMLQGSERNRPKEVKGFIALAAFPVFGIDSGRWLVSAHFRVDITEIIPFAVY
ncbi:MAG: hypothetical protein LBD96_08140 [Treponema sp.]|jgi:hypothetical protein|nr:hypothetical protein [Treponema sp.]